MAKLTKRDADEIIRAFSGIMPYEITDNRGDYNLKFTLKDGRQAECLHTYDGNSSYLTICHRAGFVTKDKISFSDFSFWQQIRLYRFFDKIHTADRIERERAEIRRRENESRRGMMSLVKDNAS